VDLKDIKAIIDLMKKNSVSEFELEKEDFKIKLKRSPAGGAAVPAIYEEAPIVTYSQSPSSAAPPNQMAGAPTIAGGSNMSGSGEQEIKSPMIGTFYRSPSPESGPYVEVGMEVNPDTVVCIIEAMKVMNEIKAEARGVITQVLVENAKPVEFGQPLYKIRPN
jgi:acetyl-CoA carboxylase biotin carboxyl carrier protein